MPHDAATFRRCAMSIVRRCLRAARRASAAEFYAAVCYKRAVPHTCARARARAARVLTAFSPPGLATHDAYY